MCPSSCGFDKFRISVDQVVFDKVEAGLNVGIFKLDKVQTCCNFFLHRDLIEFVARSLLDIEYERRALKNTNLTDL